MVLCREDPWFLQRVWPNGSEFLEDIIILYFEKNIYNIVSIYVLHKIILFQQTEDDWSVKCIAQYIWFCLFTLKSMHKQGDVK